MRFFFFLLGFRFFFFRPCEIESTFINSLPHSSRFPHRLSSYSPSTTQRAGAVRCVYPKKRARVAVQGGGKKTEEKKNGGEMRGWQNEAKRERRDRGSDRGEEEEEEEGEEEREEESAERARVSPSGALARL